MLQMPFTELQVWQKSLVWAEQIHVLTRKFPKEELYGLVSQMRRSAVSIPSNIAEGSQRTTDKEFAHFLLISRGSLAECITQLLLAKNLEYAPSDIVDKLLKDADEMSKMLYSLHKTLTTDR